MPEPVIEDGVIKTDNHEMLFEELVKIDEKNTVYNFFDVLKRIDGGEFVSEVLSRNQATMLRDRGLLEYDVHDNPWTRRTVLTSKAVRLMRELEEEMTTEIE